MVSPNSKTSVSGQGIVWFLPTLETSVSKQEIVWFLPTQRRL